MAGRKPKGCSTLQPSSVNILPHEHKILKAEALAYGLGWCQYWLLVWRNWRALGLPLQVIPPLPVDPYVPSSLKEGEKPSA